MNQILFNKINKKNLKIFKIQFLISLILIIGFIMYQVYLLYNLRKKENYSKNLLNSFNIETLYSLENSSYNIIDLNNSFSVIGIIEIPKIKIKYPILSNVSDEFLKISACRFYGPYPNKIGNLCIAAHNYDDDRFFGNLNKLNLDDEIKIYDSSNNCISYYVYDKFESLINDTSCTSQNTNGKKEITLVTCNNINKKRIIVKAKE